MALYGTALTVVQTAITTMLQEHTEADMRGGCSTAQHHVRRVPAFGMAIFGPLADPWSLCGGSWQGRGAPSSRPRLR